LRGDRVDVPVAGVERLATALRIFSGGSWATPKPSCGISMPSWSLRLGSFDSVVVLIVVMKGRCCHE
jgi:hypothetical protein